MSLRHRPRPQYLWKELIGPQPARRQVPLRDRRRPLREPRARRVGAPRLRTIYCFDAGGGTTSKALGDAISLARTELNVDIDMDGRHELAETEGPPLLSRRPSARGHHHYPATGDRNARGTLDYVRSVITEDSPGTSATIARRTRFPQPQHDRPVLRRPEVRGLPAAGRMRGQGGAGAGAGRAGHGDATAPDRGSGQGAELAIRAHPPGCPWRSGRASGARGSGCA